MKFRSIGFAVAALSIAAHAQTPPEGAIATAPLASHNCAKPAMPDAAKKYPIEEANAFVRVLESFRSCVQAFSESQKAIVVAKQKEADALRVSMLEASQAATVAAMAANTAVKDYNAFSEQALEIVTPKEPVAAKKPVIVGPPARQPQRGY